MMKNLANCTPTEFLTQTNKIRKSVQNWLSLTDILNIRKRQPKLKVASKDASAEERAAIIFKNKELMDAQVKENLMDMLDQIMDAHPKETLEILALVCFVEPEHVDDYPISDYLNTITEILNSKAVIGFFTSLVALGNANILSVSKA